MVKKPARKSKGRAAVKSKPGTESRPKARPTGSKRPGSPRSARAVTFASLLHGLAGKPSRPINAITLQAAPLAHIPYKDELELKDKALEKFWKEYRLPGHPEPLISSPRPRAYRTTSKRRCILRGPYLYLVFGDKLLQAQKKSFLESPLEPPEHGRIYSFLQRKLSEPSYKLVASHLNHLIIRGSYKERVVIFNVRKMTGPLVRKLKLLGGHLQKMSEPVAGAFAYLDPTGSDYYFESRRPEDNLQFKKLYGPAMLTVDHGGSRYNFHPTSFSQVNESIVGAMLKKSRELIDPKPEERLFDLYCGYGLFSHYLADSYKQVTGIDTEGPSIRAAQANAKFNKNGRKTRFFGRWIAPKVINDLLPLSTEPATVILDPPRQGPQGGVIEAICEKQPGKVLHIFCGVDQIPESLKEWQTNGYRVKKIVPLDMFPGTANLEVLIQLEIKTGHGPKSARKK
jgi:tRNA/tmRNA/rRNA uracil-C5-methylase (TrmA/RlmC/RlmD family)